MESSSGSENGIQEHDGTGAETTTSAEQGGEGASSKLPAEESVEHANPAAGGEDDCVSQRGRQLAGRTLVWPAPIDSWCRWANGDFTRTLSVVPRSRALAYDQRVGRAG